MRQAETIEVCTLILKKNITMCFTIKSKHEIAPPDGVECFKVVTKRFPTGFSSFWYYTYIKYFIGDEIVAASIPYRSLKLWELFKNKDLQEAIKIQRTADYIDKHYCELEGEVVHSFTNLERAKLRHYIDRYTTVIVRCVIPEGTPYWENSLSEEYASFKVKLVEVIES